MSPISSPDESRATWKVSRYPSTTLQPLGPSSNPLPSNLTVIFVEWYNPQRHSRVVYPEAFTPGHALDEIEITTSGNQHFRVYTNQPWAVMDEEVCSVVDTLNRSCLHVGSDFDLTKSLQGIVERTSASEAEGEDGPKYIVATQAQADEWMKNKSIVEFHKAKTHLPYQVQEMLSDRRTVTVGVDDDDGLIHVFTNNVDELSKPEHEGLLGHLQYKLADRVIESNHECQENRTEYSSIFADSIVNAEDSGSYSVHRIDDATCGALLKGHCRGISELNQHTLPSIARHHVSEPESSPGTAQSKRTSGFLKHPFSRAREHFHSREKEAT